MSGIATRLLRGGRGRTWSRGRGQVDSRRVAGTDRAVRRSRNLARHPRRRGASADRCRRRTTRGTSSRRSMSRRSISDSRVVIHRRGVGPGATRGTPPESGSSVGATLNRSWVPAPPGGGCRSGANTLRGSPWCAAGVNNDGGRSASIPERASSTTTPSWSLRRARWRTGLPAGSAGSTPRGARWPGGVPSRSSDPRRVGIRPGPGPGRRRRRRGRRRSGGDAHPR